ncbi:MAG: Rpn family recombination-promoting nuclease/putative transposase [Butyrivibrio sp.]|nr:Rpn family recombination-promoting nuclease/putative transposase [Butyrivibrio sp.]
MKHIYRFQSASGALKYNLTNDYMFRVVLQQNNDSLVLLLSAILHIPREKITSAKILNTIIPGASIDDKEYHLDILVSLNDNTIINLEMQVIDYGNWNDRSLGYLCRKFDNVSKGSDYSEVKPVYHISFLDFTLFKDHPEFFAKYHLRNDIDSYLYNDKFNLYVIELNHTNLATEEDKRYKIDTWAKLFKATTWEEIKMITNNNPSLNSTAESIYVYNADDIIADQCRAREETILHEKVMNERLAKLSEENNSLTDKNASLTNKNASLTSENASLTNENASLTSENVSLTNEIARLKNLLKENGIKEK